MDKIIIKESVRNLVEFCLKKGDIDTRFSGSARAVEGIRAHQSLQSDNEKIYDIYEKEVSLSYEFEMEKSIVKIEGRADGIIKENNRVIIEEIKSTYKKFYDIDDLNELHWAQAKIYGFIYCTQNFLEEIFIRLSYVQLETNEVKSFDKKFSLNELQKFTKEIIEDFEKFNIFIWEEKLKRNELISKVKFPFKKYRNGQRKLTNTCYYTIKEGEILFAQAPTGIGKTISTIFPAIKALGEGTGDRIVYLTSKNVNRDIAEEAISKLREEGLEFKTIIITAKEKICCNETFDCNPERCKYAKNYYEKVKSALLYILKNESSISMEILKKYAEKYTVCPFELSLDLSMYCDGIICDYNYIYDPRVSLVRILENGDNIVLVDEAHNLVDRSRDMYSGSLFKSQIMSCKKITKGKLNKLNSVLSKINSFFIELRNECDEKNVDWFYYNEAPKDLTKYLKLYLKESEEVLVKGNKFEGYDEIIKLYFDINAFTSTMQLYDENYVTYINRELQEVEINLFCVNPAKNLKSCLDKCYSTIFFSATLSPLTYYINMFRGSDETYRLKLPSPFNKENLKVYISPINIRYNYRKKTIGMVARKIFEFIKDEVGNYMIFSPSYVYMEDLWSEFEKFQLNDFNLIKQSSNMKELEKKEFIDSFKNNRNILAFCVLGGMYSEGIDLPGDCLIGSIIIGVGYPKISSKNHIIKDFYNENGYDYAYVFPGINKVQQAAGRVIRTENDMGRVLLIDERYVSEKYQRLLPIEWYPINKY